MTQDLPWGLIGTAMILSAFILQAINASKMPTLNLKAMFSAYFLFWSGFILWNFAAISRFLSIFNRGF